MWSRCLADVQSKHRNRKERGIEVTLNMTWLLVARRACSTGILTHNLHWGSRMLVPKRGTLQRAAVGREEETAPLISGVRGERLHLLAGNPRRSTATRRTAAYTWPLARGQAEFWRWFSRTRKQIAKLFPDMREALQIKKGGFICLCVCQQKHSRNPSVISQP